MVATAVTSSASDQVELPKLLAGVESDYGERPASALADAGYCNEADLAELESRGVDACVAPGRDGQEGDEGRRAQPGDVPDDREAGHAGGPGAVRGTQVAVGGAERLDQGSARLPALQRPRAEKVSGEWDLVCLALNVRRLGALVAV